VRRAELDVGAVAAVELTPVHECPEAQGTARVHEVLQLVAVAVAALAVGALWVLGTLGIWSVLAATVPVVAAMGRFVWVTHPLLRQRLRGAPLEGHV